MNKNKMDIVYILGKGSRWDNKEIKYSLRTVEKNLPHNRVFIVGEKPNFLKNIIHIKAEDPYPERLKNALHKLRIACEDERISDDFILMNDDFFILKRLEKIPYYYKKTLIESIKGHPTQYGYYFEAIKDTLKLLKDNNIESQNDYSLHYPFVYNKNKLLEVINMIEKTNKQILLRAFYGNYHNVGGTKKRDVKIRNTKDLLNNKYFRDSVISTSDNIVRYPKFYLFIHKNFSEKSRFEI